MSNDWLDAAFGWLDPPDGPVSRPWGISVGMLLARSHDVPAVAAKLLGQLDRFGAIRLGPVGLGLDDDDVDWKDVREIRTAPVLAILTTAALEREVDRVRKMLPPVPGRKWIVTRLVAAFQRALARLTGQHLDHGPEICAVVRYRGRFGRTREMVPGFAACLLLAAIPGLNDALLTTARAHAVTIDGHAPGPGTAERPGIESTTTPVDEDEDDPPSSQAG
jgi:hypothetical protein